MEIRRAEVSDAAALRDLYRFPGVIAGTLQLPHPSLENWRERLQKTDPNRYLLVALMQDRVVGTAGLQLMVTPRRRHSAELFVAVADDCTGQGVGATLLRELLELADKWLNVQRIELTVFVDNEAALALYRKLGFEQEGRLRAYALREGQFQDVFIMGRLKPGP